jgi:hypothetical protein
MEHVKQGDLATGNVSVGVATNTHSCGCYLFAAGVIVPFLLVKKRWATFTATLPAFHFQFTLISYVSCDQASET